MILNDLELILISKEVKVNILFEESKHFYFDTDSGEYKEKQGKKDMFDLYGNYQLDNIYEGKGDSITVNIRWRNDLYKNIKKKKLNGA